MSWAGILCGVTRSSYHLRYMWLSIRNSGFIAEVVHATDKHNCWLQESNIPDVFICTFTQVALLFCVPSIVNFILGLFFLSSTLLFVARHDAATCSSQFKPCLLYWRPFLLYLSDDQDSECLHQQLKLMTSAASYFVTFMRVCKSEERLVAFSCQSVCTRGTIGSYQKGFRETSYLGFALNSVAPFPCSL